MFLNKQTQTNKQTNSHVKVSVYNIDEGRYSKNTDANADNSRLLLNTRVKPRNATSDASRPGSQIAGQVYSQKRKTGRRE